MIPIPGRMEGDGARFYHATQNGMQFKTYEMFISGIFLSILLHPVSPWKVKPWIGGTTVIHWLEFYFFRVFLKQILKQILFRVKQLSLIKTVFQRVSNKVPWGVTQGHTNSGSAYVIWALAYDVITSSLNDRFHFFSYVERRQMLPRLLLCYLHCLNISKQSLNFSSDKVIHDNYWTFGKCLSRKAKIRMSLCIN